MKDNNWQIKIKKSAKSDLRKILNSNLKESFLDIKSTLEINPYLPTQSFEKLQPPIDQLYSRRINYQHRVVYSIDNDLHIVSIKSCWGHY